MLTKADDYPIHQLPEPVAYAGTDRNFYDRYFFNGYTMDATAEEPKFFALALGVYPHLNIMDASFSVIHGGVQHNLHASRVMNMERMDTNVGPISVEVVEPLQVLRIRVSENEHGITADLTFRGRLAPIEEPRFTHRIGPRTVLDYTRLTQNGNYEGWIEVGGERIEIKPDEYVGTRDRSWGVRPIGAPDSQPVSPPPPPQFYWLWAPLNFKDRITLFHTNDDAEGNAWNTSAVIAPIGGSPGEDGPVTMKSPRSVVNFRSGTRHAASASLHFERPEGGEVQIDLEPQFQFYMAGLGYMNPAWGHGVFKGENALGAEPFDLATLNEAGPLYLHIQAYCRARLRDSDGSEHEGAGILEQLIIGPHAPSGFKDLLDMAP